MSKRVSNSLLDPFFMPLVAPLYAILPIPKRFPPEGIIAIGHLLAAAAAIGFAYSIDYWWGGLLVAAGVLGNHIADMVDGNHARQTNQCRNGGELLDHFTDPISFSYWMIGLGVATDQPWLALVCVLWIQAMAVLTNIRAKITGEFRLAHIGPTEFKIGLALFGLTITILHFIPAITPEKIANVLLYTLWGLAILGVLQLIIQLIRAVIAVNASGKEPDKSEWVVAGDQEKTD